MPFFVIYIVERTRMLQNGCYKGIQNLFCTCFVFDVANALDGKR